jgi:KaiC/GvpD/RAD55 family RecA-like ATPase
VLAHIRDYYEADGEAQRVDPDLLAASIGRKLQNPKHQEQFNRIVADLATLDVSPATVVNDFLEVRRSAAGGRLATALAAGKSTEDVAPLLEEYREWANRTEVDEKVATVSVLKSVADLVAERTRKGGLIRVAPGSLNERLGGGLLRGHHMIVFARPEVGKTMFLVNAAVSFAASGLKVLYVGNEDPQDDIILRCLCRMSDRTRDEVLEDPAGSEALAVGSGYGNIVFADLAPGTPAEIEALVVEHKPDVIIIDQLRNLNVKEDNFVRALEKAASAVRNIGKRNNAVVISVTQAGDSASGKSVLDMGDVDNSNTGIPAQADVLLGIGMSSEDSVRGFRVLSLCKNKPGGNHDFFPVRVDPSKSWVRSAG